MEIKDQIKARAKEIIAQYPDWTNKQVNAVLRTDFKGRFVTSKTFQTLRSAPVAYEMPVFHPSVRRGQERTILVSEGFLPTEVDQLLKGLKVGIDSPVVVATRKGRINWYAGMLAKGATPDQIKTAVKSFYDKPDRSPFDFLRREYMPKKRVDFLAYREAQRRRAAGKVRVLYGKKIVKAT